MLELSVRSAFQQDLEFGGGLWCKAAGVESAIGQPLQVHLPSRCVGRLSPQPGKQAGYRKNGPRGVERQSIERVKLLCLARCLQHGTIIAPLQARNSSSQGRKEGQLTGLGRA